MKQIKQIPPEADSISVNSYGQGVMEGFSVNIVSVTDAWIVIVLPLENRVASGMKNLWEYATLTSMPSVIQPLAVPPT